MRSANFKSECGNRYGALYVLGFIGTNRHRKTLWLCRCDCGAEVIATGNNLRSGNSTACRTCSCISHGQTDSPEYCVWENMIQRCTNPKSASWKYYGAIGVIVCDRWLNSFENFLSDMGKKPSSAHSIDRFPNNAGNYEPGNCRWATASQQQLNKRNSRKAV